MYYWGSPEWSKGELCLAIEVIDHNRTETKRICGRFHKTLLDEFYRLQFGKKIPPDPGAS